MNWTPTPFLALIPLLASSALAQVSSFCPAQPNSTGGPATLTGTLGSVVGSGVHLEVSGGPPNEMGYFVVGDEATPPVAVGSGSLCLVGTATSRVYRFNVGMGGEWYSAGQFDASGVMQNLGGTSTIGTGYDVPATIPASVPIAIAAGATWHFQYWYRDSLAAPSPSNFSNGLSVTFQPPGVPIPGMVAIPAGTFAMGSDAGAGPPYFGSTTTQPVHPVTITYGFWMGQYEVTQAEYQALMGTNPSGFGGNPTYPVEVVSWLDARAYCAALTAQEVGLGNVPAGYEYRLPTEAEWEYSCRAGTTTEFNVGANLYCSDARFWKSWHSGSDCNNTPWGTGPVGSYAPNGFGLYDMHGNVFEWCLDSYASYSSVAVVDPFVTGGPNRVVRGGCFASTSSGCTSAWRPDLDPSISIATLGFRVVLAPVLIP
ncbi:MAG: formylglycine-generating enzyme family protein [Planctomycetes bacterium]|nr:formylglycine-generating enzyme family protein [Planctomycetota bacterium]MCB9911702.1 formylglycine-generating enzyme family protein [Planctomycetota bacterium]HRV80631.1 formylglycine-generating enzyme family protein [Planctomycetota bacterium]